MSSLSFFVDNSYVHGAVRFSFTLVSVFVLSLQYINQVTQLDILNLLIVFSFVNLDGSMVFENIECADQSTVNSNGVILRCSKIFADKICTRGLEVLKF